MRSVDYEVTRFGVHDVARLHTYVDQRFQIPPLNTHGTSWSWFTPPHRYCGATGQCGACESPAHRRNRGGFGTPQNPASASEIREEPRSGPFIGSGVCHDPFTGRFKGTLRELQCTDLAVVPRDTDGGTSVKVPGAEMQGVLRKNAEAFLAPAILVCVWDLPNKDSCEEYWPQHRIPAVSKLMRLRKAC